MAASTSAAAGASSSSLLASLETHNQAFEALLSLIPARHYIRDEAVDDEVRSSSRLAPRRGALLTLALRSMTTST